VLVSDLIYATPFNPQAPLETPQGLADEALAVAALEATAQQLQSQDIALDVPWGEVARLRRGEYDLPGNGTDGTLGVFYVLIYAPAPDGRLRSVAGDTHVAAIEFSDPLRAQVLMTYGNATQADAFDIGDQLQLATDKQLRPAWLTRAEIEANLASRETFDASILETLTQ
jgi:acyl-homoserine-lactone acylase